MVEELKSMVGNEETVLYEGKPNKRCFIFESIFNPLLPVAIFWAIFDLGFMGLGMASIIIVIGVLILAVLLLNLFSSDKMKTSRKVILVVAFAVLLTLILCSLLFE